ncbi:glycosyltransferase family 2 protein [Gammaproteobacteria bacterium]|nr:glycosyltransferase family 2 protein [Gammaproteobacteria bacterium]
MTEKYSVIIRVRNEERWIGHAIQSVIDFIPNNEIIIIDNNSDDKSIEIAKSFRKDPDLNGNSEHYTDINILNISSYSPGAALNLGVENASFENILVLSSHCVIKKFDNDILSTNLKKYAGIFGNQIPIYQGKKINKRYLWKHFSDEKVENMFSDMEDRHFFHNAASIFKKETLHKYPFNSNIIGKEDRYWANHVIEKNEKTLYDPNNFEVDHHYTANGNTWKGVG